MSSIYESKDRELVEKVSKLLIQRTNINVNDSEGVAYIGGNEQQRIFPKLFLTKGDIRNETGRRNVRDSALEKIRNNIESNGFEVELVDNGISIKVPEIRAQGVTDFSSLGSLEVANKIREKEYQDSRGDYETEEEFQQNNPSRPFWE